MSLTGGDFNIMDNKVANLASGTANLALGTVNTGLEVANKGVETVGVVANAGLDATGKIANSGFRATRILNADFISFYISLMSFFLYISYY